MRTYRINLLPGKISNRVSAEKKGGHEWWIDKGSLEAYVKAIKSLGSEKYNPHRNDD